MLELAIDTIEGTTKLEFEHSLRSLSKWEQKNRKPFLGSSERKATEMVMYFQDMIITPGVDPDLVYALKPEQLEELANYINANLTASWVPKDANGRPTGEVWTSELIYATMSALKINWEAQDWHLSNLMMLIQIISYKQQPPKKRNPSEVYTEMLAENERRKKLLGTSG